MSSRSGRRGFTLVEVLIATVVVGVAVAVAAQILMRSQIDSGRRLAELQNGQSRHATTRLRSDLRTAAAVELDLPGWHSDPLLLARPTGGGVVWQVIEGELHRVELDESLEEVADQVVLRGVRRWRWRSLLPGLVDVELGYSVDLAAGEVLLSARRTWLTERRLEFQHLRVAQRKGDAF